MTKSTGAEQGFKTVLTTKNINQTQNKAAGKQGVSYRPGINKTRATELT